MPEIVFNYTGGVQTWVVPTWVSSVAVEIAGAQGRNAEFDHAFGGRGGLLQATIPVVPGSTLTIIVGGRNGFHGGGGVSAAAGDARAAGGGGGKTDITGTGGIDLTAGGGGGAGGSHGVSPGGPGGGGGHGGGIAGETFVDFAGPNGVGGGGGTTSAGGAGGAGATPAWSFLGAGTAGGPTTGGTGGPGATGGSTNGSPGGGGGGGHYAGGGGGGGASAPNPNTGGGGGGGASFAYSGATNVTLTPGVRSGDGYAKIFWGSPQTNAPTGITPGSGSIVDTNTPTLGAVIVGEGVARQRVQWHISTSSDFVNNLRMITEPTSDLKVSGFASEVVPLADKLSQGAWYIRARTLDEGGAPSPYSSTQQFTVAHAPSASPVSPSSGQTVAYSTLGLTFSWQFTDTSPDDAQLAYQVIVTDVATTSTVADTGRVPSLSKIANVLIPETSKNATLSWRVRVWDQDNVAGNYTNATIFTVGDAPGISVSAMTTVATSSPTIGFTFTPIVAPLATYRVTITRDSDSALVYDSGWVSA